MLCDDCTNKVKIKYVSGQEDYYCRHSINIDTDEYDLEIVECSHYNEKTNY